MHHITALVPSAAHTALTSVDFIGSMHLHGSHNIRYENALLEYTALVHEPRQLRKG